MRRQWTLMVSSAFLLALLVGACGGDDDEPEQATLAVTLSEWAVEADQDSVAVGSVVLDVDNLGPTFPHELKVIRTDLAADALPLFEGQVDEALVEVQFAIEPFEGDAVGQTLLDAGNYVLLCNLPGHYGQGMRTTLTVE